MSPAIIKADPSLVALASSPTSRRREAEQLIRKLDKKGEPS